MLTAEDGFHKVEQKTPNQKETSDSCGLYYLRIEAHWSRHLWIRALKGAMRLANLSCKNYFTTVTFGH